MEGLTRRQFDWGQEPQILEDLEQIARCSESLYISHRLNTRYLDEVAKVGLFQRQADIFSNLRSIAEQMGYSKTHLYKNVKHIGQLFADSGLLAVCRLVRGQLESLVEQKTALEAPLSHLGAEDVARIVRASEELRSTPLFHLQRSYASQEKGASDLLFMNEFASEVEANLEEEGSAEMESSALAQLLCGLRTNIRAEERKRQAQLDAWKEAIDDDSAFFLYTEGREPRLHIGSYLGEGSSKLAWVDVDLCSLEERTILETNFSRDYRPEEREGVMARELQTLNELYRLGVRHIPELKGWELIDDERIRLIQEHYRGQDAEIRLQKDFKNGFDPASFALIVRCVLEHLCDLHEHRFIHRDLKPANILLQEVRGKDKRRTITGAAVTDFGFTARLEKGKRTVPTECGSPPFLAPEFWKTGKTSTATDIWAAGASLFECRYGQAFIDGDVAENSDTGTHVKRPRASCDLPTNEKGLERYYAKRAYGSRKQVKNLDAIDRFILSLLHPKSKKRPSAEEALEAWNLFEKHKS